MRPFTASVKPRASLLRFGTSLLLLLVSSACGAPPPECEGAKSASFMGADLQRCASPRWEPVQQRGDIPPALWEASVSFARTDGERQVVYRFGGQRGNFPNDPTVNDFHAFDVSTATWTNLTTLETPAARAETLMIPGPCNLCVSIVGGRGRFRTGSDLMFPEMWTYDTPSRRWQGVPAEALGDAFSVRRSSALVVEVPEAGHPEKTVFYAFGGVGNTLSRFATTSTGLRNDVAVYGQDMGWRLAPTAGERPVPRAWVAGGYDPNSRSLLVFGGYRLGADQGPRHPPGSCSVRRTMRTTCGL